MSDDADAAPAAANPAAANPAAANPAAANPAAANPAALDPSDTSEAGRQAQRRQRIEQLKAELVGGDLFSAAEVAEILDIHPRTVNEYVREGKLKAIQMGGGWKISERALRAFVRDQTTDYAQQQYLSGAGPVTPVTPVTTSIPGAQAAPSSHAGSPSPAGAAGARVTPGSPARAARASKGPNYKCSFCGKHQELVSRLIAGPGGVYICDACIALSNDILAQEAAKAKT